MKKSNIFVRGLYTLVHLSFALILILLAILPMYLFSKIKCLLYSRAKLFKEFATSCKVMLFALGVDYQIDGSLPTDDNFIVTANHTSILDVFIICALYNGRKGTIFVNKYLFKIPILGFFLRNIGAIIVDVVKDKDGMVISSKMSDQDKKRLFKLLKEGYDAFFFPEGTRTLDGKLLPFQEGAAVISMRSGKKIIPIGMHGGYEFYSKKSWLLNPKALPVTVKVGEPIQYKGSDRKELTTLLRENIKSCIESAKIMRTNLLTQAQYAT